MDERLDKQIMQLNSRYQELVFSGPYQIKKSKSRYLRNFLRGNIGQIIEDLRYRKCAITRFSTDGNTVCNTEGTNDASHLKIVVYSSIIGKYDRIIEPVMKEETIDYYMFTDQQVPADSVWTKIDVTQLEEYGVLSPVLLNRKIKILPHLFLEGYDYSVYVDGNIEIVAAVSPIISSMGTAGLGVHYHSNRDCIFDEAIAVKHYKRAVDIEVDEQLKKYETEGFPRHYGLFENSILVRKHQDVETQLLMEAWWKEYLKRPTRDQFSLPYVTWKNNFAREHIYILGTNISKNARFNRISKHLK